MLSEQHVYTIEHRENQVMDALWAACPHCRAWEELVMDALWAACPHYRACMHLGKPGNRCSLSSMPTL